MSKITFRSKTDLTLAAIPSNGSYIVAYDTNTGFLSQKDDQGIITIIGSSGVGLTGATGPQGIQGPTGSSGVGSGNIFYNLGTLVSATNSTTAIYRTGSLNIGTGTASNSRFVVSSIAGTTSLVVTEDGSVYNRGGGNNDSNTAFGNGALVSNTPDGGGPLGSNGTYNVALGTGALGSNTTGYANMAIGSYALYYSTNSTYNLAIGGSALLSNTTGTQNMAIGAYSLLSNTSGTRNTAIGTSALQNSRGDYNTTIGNYSGVNMTYASSNILIGFQSGSDITTGQKNTIIAETGYGYTNGITTGSNNLIIAQNHGNATGITTGSNNTIIGKVTGLATGLSASVILSDGLGNIRFYSDSNGNSAIGTTSPTASAIFQIDSITQGFLPPRMTNTQRTSISNPAIGLIVYCTDVTEGLYVYKSGGWQFIA
jgi:hypothetical protein